MISIRPRMLIPVVFLSYVSLFGGLTKQASVSCSMRKLCPSVVFSPFEGDEREATKSPCVFWAKPCVEMKQMAVAADAIGDAKKKPIKTYADAVLIGELKEALPYLQVLINDQQWEEKASIKGAYIAKVLEALDKAQHSQNDEVQRLCSSMIHECGAILQKALSCLGALINAPKWNGSIPLEKKTEALKEKYVLAAMAYAKSAQTSSCLLLRWLAKNIAKNCVFVKPDLFRDQDVFDASKDQDTSDLSQDSTDTDSDDEVASISSLDSSDDDALCCDDELLGMDDEMLANLRKTYNTKTDDNCIVQ